MKSTLPTDSHDNDRMRLDKWLWAARFYKTRALAVEEILKARVQVNGLPCKPARDIRCGDTVSLRQGTLPRTVVVGSARPIQPVMRGVVRPGGQGPLSTAERSPVPTRISG